MKNKKLLLQIFRFIIVGGIATIIDYIIFFIMHDILHISTLISNIMSFSISVVYNYIASVKWVFEVDETKDKKQQFVIFIVLSIVGLGINTGIVYLCIDILKFYSIIAKVLATGVVMVFNFITRKIFLEKQEAK